MLTNRANILLKELVDLITLTNFYTEDPISMASMYVVLIITRNPRQKVTPPWLDVYLVKLSYLAVNCASIK